MGKFGHQCSQCRGYWRCNGSPSVYPYCAAHGERHDFLSDAQRRYVQQYCEVLSEALNSAEDGDHIIDMDAVADAAGKDIEKPPFYYAEESQQNKFTCGACRRVQRYPREVWLLQRVRHTKRSSRI